VIGLPPNFVLTVPAFRQRSWCSGAQIDNTVRCSLTGAASFQEARTTAPKRHCHPSWTQYTAATKARGQVRNRRRRLRRSRRTDFNPKHSAPCGHVRAGSDDRRSFDPGVRSMRWFRQRHVEAHGSPTRSRSLAKNITRMPGAPSHGAPNKRDTEALSRSRKDRRQRFMRKRWPTCPHAEKRHWRSYDTTPKLLSTRQAISSTTCGHQLQRLRRSARLTAADYEARSGVC